ncbi:unnamed protein product [Onchocerca flexuosa]|uniref:TPR_REGION domain-containing protein n=1 Tax=Onchocerca flexuosa TaxID=387005 RepID=A0A183I0Z5_9BILA|nr:unnamed protein product [Onchocerca flexuosa]
MTAMELDPFLQALLHFKHNDIEKAIKICSEILEKNPYDQAAWSLKLSCLTEEFYVDELENDERGIAEIFLDDTVLASRARPGTSLSRPVTSDQTSRQAIRPVSSSGRPISGVLRPETHVRPGTMEQTLRTSRTSRTTRATSSSSARFVRLGTASMISEPNGPFVNLSRLNVDKYAADSQVNRNLFEYVFYHEADMKVAHQIAVIAIKNAGDTDWYWKNQLGKSCFRLGLFNDALKHFHSSLSNQKMAETYAYLAKTYCRIDQPLMAIDHYNSGLQFFRNDITLLIGLARVHESSGDVKMASRCFQLAMAADPNHAESVCNFAILQMRDGKIDQSRSMFRSAIEKGPHLFEPCYNLALLTYQINIIIGQFDESRRMVLKALELYPEHVQSKTILGHIEQMFHML